MRYKEILELTRAGWNSEQICALEEKERQEIEEERRNPHKDKEEERKGGAAKMEEPRETIRAEPEMDYKTLYEEMKKDRDELNMRIAKLEIISAEQPIQKEETLEEILMKGI